MKNYFQFKDITLLQMTAQGDSTAWETIVRRHGNTVYSILFHTLGSHQDMDDAVQNVFIMIRKYAAKYHYGECADKWIKTIASREAIRVLRKHYSRQKREESLEEAVQTAAEPQDIETEPSTTDIHQQIRQEITRLPDQLRAAVVLNFSGELTQAEIAERMQTNQSTISKRVKRGVELLKKNLAAAGVTGAYVLSPDVISTSILNEKISASTVNKILHTGAQSGRLVHAVRDSSARTKKTLILTLVSISAISLFYLAYWLPKSTHKSQKPQPISRSLPGKKEFIFTDTMENGLKDEWEILRFRLTSGKDATFVDQLSGDDRQTSQISFEKIPEMKSGKSLVIHKIPESRDLYCLAFHRSVLPGDDVTFTFDFLGIRNSSFSSILFNGREEMVSIEHKKNIREGAGNRLRIEIKSRKKSTQAFFDVNEYRNGVLIRLQKIYTDSIRLVFFNRLNKAVVDNVTIRFLTSRHDVQTDSAAWEEIVCRYQDTVYSLLHYMLRNTSDVDDAFQNTFIQIRKSAANFRYGESAKKWIKTIASREALQMMNKKNRQRKKHVKINQ